MILRLMLTTILLMSSLIANEIDDKLIAFEQKRLDNDNKRMTIQKITVIHKQSIEIKGWYGYILDLKIKVQDKIINAKDVLFSNGVLVTTDLQDLLTGESLKETIVPELSRVYYNNEHLIAGSHKSKNKIVIFSDPLCPACQSVVPNIIKYVNNNSNDIGLYYYHFPLLRLHPASDALSRSMIIAKDKGMKNIELKVYEKDFSAHFESSETSDEVILKGFNKEFKTNITLNEIQTEKIKNDVLNDIQMGDEVLVNSTPTIFINGKKDKTQIKYKKLGK